MFVKLYSARFVIASLDFMNRYIFSGLRVFFYKFPYYWDDGEITIFKSTLRTIFWKRIIFVRKIHENMSLVNFTRHIDNYLV
jgi:hypothetical protein